MTLLSVGSLFSGVEGFGLGFERAGMRVAWQSEIDPSACRVLKHHFPEVPNYGDITTIDPAELPAVDVICGGFPCVDVSIAGRRAGLAGERSGLWWEFRRLVAARRPRWVVIENVVGLLSSNRGRDMGAIVGALADMGYGWAYRVMDAQWAGLAQRRKRVFIVGCLGDWRAPAEVLFEPESVLGADPPRRETGQDVAATLGARATAGGTGYELDASGAFIPMLAHTLTSGGADASEDGTGRGSPLVPMIVGQHGVAVAISENQRAELILSDVTRALTLGGGKPGQGYQACIQWLRDHLMVRRLTPREWERLMGFPDDFTLVPNAQGKPMADAPRYRMLGNSIAVPVAAWLGGRIAEWERSR